jgi:CRP-like cAMP-binding protein
MKVQMEVRSDNSDHRGIQSVKNRILLQLPKSECTALFSKLEYIQLPVRSVLNEATETIKYAYFINDGLASVLSMIMDGRSVEVGLCGNEGFVGLPLVAGYKTSHTRIIMQVGGSAYRIKAKDLTAALKDCSELATSLNRYSQKLALQASQVAACNRLHEIEERLARWLVMSQDRLGGNMVPLTQEFLAHMLGTRRASVTVAAGMLQKAGLISYQRGALKIESRAKLEAAACECYRVIVKQTGRWESET